MAAGWTLGIKRNPLHIKESVSQAQQLEAINFLLTREPQCCFRIGSGETEGRISNSYDASINQSD